MESCEPNNGRAYVVFREEKNVNELGKNVPSLVPYDYSSEEEETVQPKSDSSRTSKKSIIKSLPPEQYFVDGASYDELRFYTEDDSDEDDVPGSPEVYNIYTTDKTFDVSFCMDILKASGCSESNDLYQPDIPGYFCAKLHKEVEKVKGVFGIVIIKIYVTLDKKVLSIADLLNENNEIVDAYYKI